MLSGPKHQPKTVNTSYETAFEVFHILPLFGLVRTAKRRNDK